MRAIAFATLLALTVVPVVAQPAFAQGPGETINVAGWRIHNQKDADGSQTCAAVWTYDDKSFVGFTVNTDNQTFLVISEPEAELTKNESVQFKYRVDKGPAKTVNAIATSPKMVVAPISDPDVDFAAFRKGKTLFVEFGGDTYEDSLDHANEAIKGLGACIVKANAGK